jgi:1-pyrroline-5-carboxylate dehydrogenase
MTQRAFRITYATMSADNEALHAAYEKGLEVAKSWLGQKHPFSVNGEAREGETYDEERSPIDRDIVIGRFARASVRDVNDAVAAAKAFSAEWSGMPWRERVTILRRVAEAISDRVFELAALMAIEVGKSRLEALGDVEETADLIRYYCKSLEDNDGFQFQMDRLSEQEDNRSVLRPFGVWAVVSPFNFPMALAGGPAGGALVAGNTVVLKPSHQSYFTAHKLHEAMRAGGVPAGAFHLVTGPGSTLGKALYEHPDVAGLTFTGSSEVGMQIYKNFAREYPKPAICEMGGKNPAIVTAKADLDKAAEGVMRSAFGYSGQKCSACSRVYVERPVYDRFIERLRERASRLRVGNPLERQVYTGPVINEGAVETFEKAVEDVKAGGGRVLLGGGRILEGDLHRGHFVQPTIVEAPLDNRVWKEELFVPFVAVAPVDSLDEAIRLANDTEYGLTAGLYSQDQTEIDTFLNAIQAGVVYVNRKAGATTGAWPGMQPFGGWKGSGTTGKAGGGLFYLQQYLREQSRAIVVD